MMGFYQRLKKANPVTMEKIIKHQARKEFAKRGDHCEHDDKKVCDACLDKAVGIARETSKTLTFKEKLEMAKQYRDMRKQNQKTEDAATKSD